jgi:LmbE family N-acetylglucosaminyl deacetylase
MSSASSTASDLAAPSHHFFLSPHYDDIALSVGATVRRLADLGRSPQTLIVFGSEPDQAQPLSPFAQSLHEDWGLSADDVIGRRQAEERAAAAILGATMRVLPFRDAIYRGNLYLSDDDLFGTPAEAERDLPLRIASALDLPEQPDPDVRLYAPLAVGRHVDHQLVHLAGSKLAQRGWDVWFYEDIPYALKPGAFAARMAEINGAGELAPIVNIPATPTWNAKTDAILCYPSQLETIFRQYVGVGTSRYAISAALDEYASQAGSGATVERFWRKLNTGTENGG